MAIRGSAIQTGTGSSVVVSLPAGSAAGDLAILFSASGFTPSTPSGWTSLYLDTALTWQSMGASKVLSSGDISTGSVTASFSGSFDCVGAVLVFVGASGGVRETQSGHNAGGTATTTLTTTSAVLGGETGVYFATVRAGTASPTITPASGSATILQTGITTNGYSLLAYQTQPGGAFAVAYSYTTAGSGEVSAQVIAEISAVASASRQPLLFVLT